jgi:Flp pilus assembly protein TadG
MGGVAVSRRRILKRRCANWWRREDGQGLVEFALVVPVLLLLIVGLAEFSRAWNTKQVLTDAAREALRSSVVANPDFTYQAMLNLIDQALLRASLDPERAEVSVENWKAGTGTPARIRIDYRYELGIFGALAGWATGDRTLVLSTSFAMRNE